MEPSPANSPVNLAKAICDTLEARGIGKMDFVHAVAKVGDDPPHWRSVHRVTTGETQHPNGRVRAAIEEVLGWPEGAVSAILAGEDPAKATRANGPTTESRLARLESEVALLMQDYMQRRAIAQ